MTLHVRVDSPPPRTLPAGSANVVFCAGCLRGMPGRLAELEVLVDGEPRAVSAHGMPRPDLAGAGDELFCGFWVVVPISARSAGHVYELAMRATPRAGQPEQIALGRITASVPEPRDEPDPRWPPETIAICMATFDPDEALFRAQIASLRAQTDHRWICLISDDCSAPERFQTMRDVIGGDTRFRISRSERRLGFYRNFERALELVPPGVELVALCDQDDRWQADKLATLRSEIGDALLIYSDMRLVEADGRVRRETMWCGRRNNHDSLASMLIANSITGASAMFRSELIELALPFPYTPGFQFHDHWLAIVALSAGRVAYVDRPLYDYVQHPRAVFGDVTHGASRHESLRARLSVVRWRAAYFYGYLARQAQADVAMRRCAGRLSPSKRRVLTRFIACDRSFGGLPWLALRPLRALAGRNETLGSELELAQGLIWKRAAAWRARYRHPRPRLLTDASIPSPDAFVQTRLRRWRAKI